MAMTIPDFIEKLKELIKTHNVVAEMNGSRIQFRGPLIRPTCALGFYQQAQQGRIESLTETMRRDGMSSADAWAIMSANDDQGYGASEGFSNQVNPEVRRQLLEVAGLLPSK